MSKKPPDLPAGGRGGGCQRGLEWAVWSPLSEECHVSTAHTVALCPARGRVSMGPLMGHPRPFIVHLATEHGALGGVGGGCVVQHLAGMPSPRAPPRQNKSHSVERLLEINFLSVVFFAFIKRRTERNRMMWGKSVPSHEIIRLYTGSRSFGGKSQDLLVI